MNNQIARYIICVIPILLGAWDISSALKAYEVGKYFGAAVNLMMTIWMICLFVKIFFDL